LEFWKKEYPKKPICVLHIDDSKWVRIPVSVLLRRHFGMRVLEAENGPDGIRLAEEEHPDLIILDVMMPQMDGFDTLARLRTVARTKDIPVLMCTARDLTRDVNTALRLGALGYITKPIQEDHLVSKVREILVSIGKWGQLQRIHIKDPLPSPSEVVVPSEVGTPATLRTSRPENRHCPGCQATLDFIDQYEAWYCYSCRRYPDFPEN
jgi:twitching motility two-component system response regulator PilH